LQKEKSDQRLPLEDYPERFRALGTTKLQPASSWIKAAQAGDTLAQYELGMCHEKGEGVAFDRQAAIMWFRKSAQGGYAPAQFVLGYFHQWGNGLEYDHGEVVRWYGKAAAQGYAKAQYNLGRYYGQGQSEIGKVVRGQSDLVWSKIGIPKNPGEAVKWYRRAAENGHLLAQYEMGKIYHSGEGVAKDQVEAFKWWLKAAEQGHATSRFNIGVMYFLGRGTTKDFSEAARWFRIRSNQEDGLIFFCGVGRPIPRPMVDGIQTSLAPLNDIPEVR
jgi:TPR repeat protein